MPIDPIPRAPGAQRNARHFCAIFSVLSSLAAPGAAAAQATAALTIEEVAAIPQVGDVSALPRGGVAWVESSKGAANLFVARPPAYVPARLTHNKEDDGVALELADVSRDGERLLYFSGGLPNDAGETPNPQSLPEPTQRTLWSLALQTGVSVRIDGGPGSSIQSAIFAADGARVLYAKGNELWTCDLPSCTPRRLFTARGSIGSLLLSPQGKRLAFVSDRSGYGRGNYAFVGVYDPERRSILYMAPGLGIDQSPTWSPDGERIAFIRFGYEPKTWRFTDHREGAPFAIVVADARTGEGATLWTAAPGRGSRFSGFGPDGYDEPGSDGALLWLADGRLVFPYEQTGWRLLYAIAGGGTAALNREHDLVAQPMTPGRFEIDGARLSPDRSKVVYWANSAADPHRLHLYEMSAAAHWRPRALTTGDGIEHDAIFSADSRSIFYRQAQPTTPQRLVALRDFDTELQLSSGPKPGDAIGGKTHAGEIVTFKAADGMTIPAILFRPAGRHARHSMPAVVHAHGGSRSKMYPVWDRFAVLRYLMSRGYVVLTVNYRSGVGYGLDFREPESYGGRGAGDVQDFIAAAQYLTSQVPEVDPARLVIYGHSYGGHIVSNALARSNVFAAGVDSAGVGDWVVEMQADEGESLPFNIAQRAVLEELAYRSSAISLIDQWGNEPILFLHGDDDHSAAMQQSIELYQALKRRGKRAEALVMTGESHGLSLYRNHVRQLRVIEDFLARHLHDAPARSEGVPDPTAVTW